MKAGCWSDSHEGEKGNQIQVVARPESRSNSKWTFCKAQVFQLGWRRGCGVRKEWAGSQRSPQELYPQCCVLWGSDKVRGKPLPWLSTLTGSTSDHLSRNPDKTELDDLLSTTVDVTILNWNPWSLSNTSEISPRLPLGSTLIAHGPPMSRDRLASETPSASCCPFTPETEKMWFSFYDYTHHSPKIKSKQKSINGTITGHLIYNSFKSSYTYVHRQK